MPRRILNVIAVCLALAVVALAHDKSQKDKTSDKVAKVKPSAGSMPVTAS